MTTLALYGNKGGVGKTTAAVNLAWLASQGGLTTLIVDLDPQGSASYFFRIKPRIRRGARGLTKGARPSTTASRGPTTPRWTCCRPTSVTGTSSGNSLARSARDGGWRGP